MSSFGKTEGPWKMWGNSQPIEFQAIGTGTEGNTEVPAAAQFLRIDYGRPETWRFLFFAQITNWSVQSEIADLQVFFDLTPGLGRAQSTIRGFEHFVFSAPAVGQSLWSTSVNGPVRDPDATDQTNRIELIPAQSITLGARMVVGSLNENDLVQVIVSAYFSPNTHVRPEWYSGQFPGGEDQTL